MKNLIILIGTIFILNANADNSQVSKPRSIPADAELIETKAENLSIKEFDGNDKVGAQCTEKVRTVPLQLKNKLNAENTCSVVYYKISVTRDKTRDIGWGANTNRRNIIFEVYCTKRSFSEMAALSLYETCKQNPMDACYQPEILERLDNIAPTQYFTYQVGSCN